jgi:hypothetical protein
MLRKQPDMHTGRCATRRLLPTRRRLHRHHRCADLQSHDRYFHLDLTPAPDYDPSGPHDHRARRRRLHRRLVGHRCDLARCSGSPKTTGKLTKKKPLLLQPCSKFGKSLPNRSLIRILNANMTCPLLQPAIFGLLWRIAMAPPAGLRLLTVR